jgi:hypothetical protein
MTSTDADKLIAAARQATAERDAAFEEAARLLNPPPPSPVAVVADLLVQLKMVRGDRDALTDERDNAVEAMSADMDAIRGMVGRPTAPIVEAVRQAFDDWRKTMNERDTANWHIGQIAVALGLSECAPAVMVRARAGNLCAEVERLSALLATAEADAKTQRTAADDLRAALDRVAEASGFGPDGAAPDIADRVIAVIRGLKSRPVLTVERLADALRAVNVTLQPTTTAFAVMAAMSHMGDLVLPESSPTSRPAALPADLRTYLETRRDRLQGGHGLGLAAEIAALKRWIALPTAEVAK